MCLYNKHHLQYFKSVIFCIFFKSKKRICSEFGLYCLIALFLYLKKLLEKIVAKHLSIFIFKAKFFSNLHFRAIFDRFIIDVISTLMHDKKKAIQ